MSAMASSEPGSVSKMIFLAADVGRARRKINEAIASLECFGICFLLSGSSDVG